jgi:hypothetical protein
MPPMLAKPGFPFEASLKFNLKNMGGGGSQRDVVVKRILGSEEMGIP